MNPETRGIGVAAPSYLASPHRVDYDEIYRLRRRVSTMHDVVADWLDRSIRTWCRDADPIRPVRILSVGCGDGDLDVRLIGAASSVAPIEYLGCDVNTTSLRAFEERLEASLIDSTRTTVRLVDVAFDDLPDGEPFDFVLLSHMLYYVDDPGALVLQVLDGRCAPGGRVVVVQSGYDGVPSMTEQALGFTPFVTAESILDDLRRRGVTPRVHLLDTEFRLDDTLVDSPQFADLVGFLVERENLGVDEVERVAEVMKSRSTPVDGRRVMREQVVVIEVGHRLPRSATARVRPAIDPIRDYHALEEAFEWGSFLGDVASRTVRRPRLLDVGCGTGRWLRVLAAARPETTSPERERFVYDRVDPVSLALVANAEIASAMFDVGETWNDVVEKVDLPIVAYDVIWSIHSMYALARDRVESVINKLVASLAPRGVLVVALGARGSFYVDAKPTLTGTDPFLSFDEVAEVVERLGLTYRVHHVDYVERFPHADEEAIRRFVWHEAIGNTYLPAGLVGDLPEMPTGEWFDKFRGPTAFEFAQRTGVIVIER